MAQPHSSVPQKQHADDGDSLSVPKFSCRIESFRDIADLDYGGYYYDGSLTPVSPCPSSCPKGSLAELPAPYDGITFNLKRSNSRRLPKLSGSFAYQAVDGNESATPPASVVCRTSSTWSRESARYSGVVHTAVEVILEGRESVDIALLPAAEPIDEAEKPLPDVPRTKPVPGESEWQAQERAGHLSGGLDICFAPGMTIQEADLLSHDGQSTKRALRPMSFSRRGTLLTRSATRKALGQDEADKTGNAVQVVINDRGCDERKDAVDLSTVAGEGMGCEELNETMFLKPRNTTCLSEAQQTETFHPKSNWKPFSMRWPYLSALITLSIVLAAITEVLYQSSDRTSLVFFHTQREIKPAVYFAIKFLPTTTAVVFGVLWQITDSEVLRLEAFYQLSRECGANAAETLNIDYLTMFSFMRPIRALQLRQYAVAVSSVASLLAVSAVPTLSAASIILTPNRSERLKDPTGLKEILVHPIWSRILEVILLLIATMGCVLFYQLHTRRSGLLADVKGIAGLAAMANVSDILMDFQDMDVATDKDIHHRLASRRYVLRNSSLAPLPIEESSMQEKTFGVQYLGRAKAEPTYTLPINPHPPILRAAGLIPLITSIILFTTLIPISLFTPAGYLTDKAPWALTALAVCIRLGWAALDITLRVLEPFYILHRRHAPPSTLALDYTAMPSFAWAPIKALLNGHWLVSAVGLGTLMVEALTVLVTSLAAVGGRDFIVGTTTTTTQAAAAAAADPAGGDDMDAGQETARSSWIIPLAVVLFILVYMCTEAGAVLARRGKPFLPRRPGTMAGVLALVHQSRMMLYDLVGTEEEEMGSGGGEEVARVELGGGLGKKTYGLGWFEGRDGRVHFGVDEEELVAGYRSGGEYGRGGGEAWAGGLGGWV